MHCLAHKVFPQHGADDGAAVASPGEGCAAGAFEMHVPPAPANVHQFAEQERPAVAEQR